MFLVRPEGAMDRHQMILGMKELFRQSMMWSIGLSAIFFIFAEPIAMCFIQANQDVIKQSAFAIRCYAIGIPFMTINQCAASYLQATKCLKASNYVIVADRLVFIVALVYILGFYPI